MIYSLMTIIITILLLFRFLVVVIIIVIAVGTSGIFSIPTSRRCFLLGRCRRIGSSRGVIFVIVVVSQ